MHSWPCRPKGSQICGRIHNCKRFRVASDWHVHISQLGIFAGGWAAAAIFTGYCAFAWGFFNISWIFKERREWPVIVIRFFWWDCKSRFLDEELEASGDGNNEWVQFFHFICWNNICQITVHLLSSNWTIHHVASFTEYCIRPKIRTKHIQISCQLQTGA